MCERETSCWGRLVFWARPSGILMIQGQVSSPFADPLRGLQVRSTATGNLSSGLEPQLSVDTNFIPPVFTITSLPSNGALLDSTGTAITAVPAVLPDGKVTYTGNLGFFGPDSFGYEAAGAVVDPGFSHPRCARGRLRGTGNRLR